MLKKILIAVFMTTLFITQNVSAQDVWVHTDRNSGIEYYVMTETFNQRQKNDYHFDIDVKYVRNGKLIDVKTYSFDGHDGVSYKIDGVYKGTNFDKGGMGQPATDILSYCARNFKLSNRMGN